MKIDITMFDVRDGDAILVHLSKENHELIMVIDGGRKSDYANVMSAPLKALLKKLHKQAPDIVVCTHYDADHVTGLVPLLEEYGEHIQQLWVNVPPALSKDISRFEKTAVNPLAYLKNKQAVVLEKYAKELFPTENAELIREQAELVLESVGDLRTLLNKIDKRKVRPVFYNRKTALLKDWPEIVVLGPTEDYFDELFPKGQTLEEFVLKEARGKQNSMPPIQYKEVSLIKRIEDPCSMLEPEAPPSLTDTNKSSIIISIEPTKEHKLLFTGDAGTMSFERIPNYRQELKNLYWLKVPHHGSINNMSNSFASLMNPVYADCSGARHIDDVVLKCLEKKPANKSVRNTRDDGTLTVTYPAT